MSSPRGPSGTTNVSAAPPWRCPSKQSAQGQDGSSWTKWHRRWARRSRKSRQLGSPVRRSCAETTAYHRRRFTDMGGPWSQPALGSSVGTLGGLTGDKILELTQNFAGDPVLGRIQILLLQEVVTEVGLFFDTRYDWTIVYGKKEGTWRGEGILYHKQQGMHHHSQLHTHAISTTIRCPHTAARCRYIAAHLPHHATVEQTAALMAEWGQTMPKHKAWLGMDANETFTATPGGGVQLPPQDLATPTFHPYNTTMQSRRLDYLFVRSRRGVGAGGGANPAPTPPECAMGSGSRLPTPAGEIGGPAC